MLIFVDPGGRTWWYQQLPHVEATLIPVRERSLKIQISLGQAFVRVVSAGSVHYEHAGTSEIV
jgi:hypothetical protein